MRRKYTVWIEGSPRELIGAAEWDAFRADYKFVLAAGGAVTDEHGRLLVIRRLGKWDLPKGKVDEGEAIDAAAMREVHEECGLNELHIVRAMTSTWHTYERKGKQHHDANCASLFLSSVCFPVNSGQRPEVRTQKVQLRKRPRLQPQQTKNQAPT